MSFKLQSSAFNNNARIPKQYTCDGNDTKIPLLWKNPPKGTVSFAIIMNDPDTAQGNFIHWIAWNIDANVDEIINDMINYQTGYNSSNKLDYKGPCPPGGSGVHRYIFTIYALNTMLDIKKDKITSDDLLKAMIGHILGTARLTGRYGKS